MKKVLLIITGSIACYKSLELTRQLGKKSYQVTCILTRAAEEFITKLLVTSISGNQVHSELFSSTDEAKMGHIALARENDLIVVAPATADFIAKIANGYADDLASSVILASNSALMLAPAMNEKMWLNSVTQENLAKLYERGVMMLEPKTDVLACGEYGIGKMVEVEKIVAAIEDYFVIRKSLKGKKVLITGGATHEPIDSVRFIGNNSSGKQAIAIAKNLEQAGAEVTFIAGNINKPISASKTVKVKTADEMLAAVEHNLAVVDVFIGCAAVADYKVKNPVKTKIKKSDFEELKLELIKNPDILERVGRSKSRPKLVIGFAAEEENLIPNSLKKLKEKNCDLVVGNYLRGGEIFGSNETEVVMVDKNHSAKEELRKITKEQLAKELVLKIATLL